MGREWGGTTIASTRHGDDYGHLYGRPRPRSPAPRRRVFPNGWADVMHAAFALAGFALAFLFAATGWVLLEPLVMRK